MEQRTPVGPAETKFTKSGGGKSRAKCIMNAARVSTEVGVVTVGVQSCLYVQYPVIDNKQNKMEPYLESIGEPSYATAKHQKVTGFD